MIASDRSTYPHTVYINFTHEKIQFSDLPYPSLCLLFFFFFAFFLRRTDGLVVIGHRWGFRGNIKHPTQCYICPSFDSKAEIISKLYRLLLSYVCVSAAYGLRQASKRPYRDPAIKWYYCTVKQLNMKCLCQTLNFLSCIDGKIHPDTDVYLFMFADVAALGFIGVSRRCHGSYSVKHLWWEVPT